MPFRLLGAEKWFTGTAVRNWVCTLGALLFTNDDSTGALFVIGYSVPIWIFRGVSLTVTDWDVAIT